MPKSIAVTADMACISSRCESNVRALEAMDSIRDSKRLLNCPPRVGSFPGILSLREGARTTASHFRQDKATREATFSPQLHGRSPPV